MKFGNLITSSENRGSKKDFDKVTLDDNLLIFRSITIQIQNISRLTSYEIKKTCQYKLLLFLLTTISLSLTFIVFALSELKYFPIIELDFGLFRFYIHIGYFITPSVILVFLLLDAIYYIRYGVQIQTDGSTIDQLITNDRATADELCITKITPKKI